MKKYIIGGFVGIVLGVVLLGAFQAKAVEPMRKWYYQGIDANAELGTYSYDELVKFLNTKKPIDFEVLANDGQTVNLIYYK